MSNACCPIPFSPVSSLFQNFPPLKKKWIQVISWFFPVFLAVIGGKKVKLRDSKSLHVYISSNFKFYQNKKVVIILRRQNKHRVCCWHILISKQYLGGWGQEIVRYIISGHFLGIVNVSVADDDLGDFLPLREWEGHCKNPWDGWNCSL